MAARRSWRRGPLLGLVLLLVLLVAAYLAGRGGGPSTEPARAPASAGVTDSVLPPSGHHPEYAVARSEGDSSAGG